MAILSSLALERDEEVRLMTASTARDMLRDAAADLPKSPLPSVVLPRSMEAFLTMYGQDGAEMLLQWFLVNVYGEMAKQSLNNKVSVSGE